MKIRINESVITYKELLGFMPNFFAATERGQIHIKTLINSNDEDYYALIKTPEGEYGFIPKHAYLGVKEVPVTYHNGRTGIQKQPVVDMSLVVLFKDATPEQLQTTYNIIVGDVSEFNEKLKYRE